jgi:uracil phosphoribosyltransferase
MQVYEMNHALGKQCLTRLRDKTTSLTEFRENTHRLGTLLFAEASRQLECRDCNIETPLSRHRGTEVVQAPVLIPILRAGLALLDIGLKFWPGAPVGMLGIRRDEETAEPSLYYKHLPGLANQDVLILEPMLASGGSLELGLEQIVSQQPKSVAVISVVAAPQGIERLASCEILKVFVSAIDETLNDRKYIVPGLGDFGDRWCGTSGSFV